MTPYNIDGVRFIVHESQVYALVKPDEAPVPEPEQPTPPPRNETRAREDTAAQRVSET